MSETPFSKKVFHSFIQNITGGGVTALASIVSGYFYALFLGPATYGVWQTAKVFLSYGTFTCLGIPFVMRRDFVTLRSEGRFADANRMAHVAMTYNFIINPAIALIFISIAFLSYSKMAFRASLILVGVLYITDIFSGIGNIIHKGINDYKTLAVGSVINGIGLLLLIPLVYLKGYYAFLIGFFMLSIIKSSYFIYKKPIEYKWVWDFPLLKRMIFTAFPIFLVTITSTVFLSVDRLLIAGLLNFKNVGLYSLSAFIAQPIVLLVSSFSIVLFTHLNERYGRSKEHHVIAKHVYLPQLIFSNLLPPLVGMGVIALPFFTHTFLPKYNGGIIAAQISIFAILFMNLAGFSANGLFVLDKQKYTALSFFIAGCIKTAGSYFALKAGYGIESVASFTLLAYFIYNSMMLYYINKYLGKDFKAYIFLLFNSLVCPLAIFVFCLIYLFYHSVIFNVLGIQNQLAQTFIGLVLVSLVGSVFLYKAYKDINGFFKK